MSVFFEQLTCDDSGARAGIADRFLPNGGKWTTEQQKEIIRAWADFWSDDLRAEMLPFIYPHFASVPALIRDWIDSRAKRARQGIASGQYLLSVLESLGAIKGAGNQ